MGEYDEWGEEEAGPTRAENAYERATQCGCEDPTPSSRPGICAFCEMPLPARPCVWCGGLVNYEVEFNAYGRWPLCDQCGRPVHLNSPCGFWDLGEIGRERMMCYRCFGG